MTQHNIKQYDDLPEIDETLFDGDRNAINLATATAVWFHMSDPTTGAVLIHRTATIYDVTQATNVGRVRFFFNTNSVTGETADHGTFPREWQIQWANGKVQRVPNTGNDTVKIAKAAAVNA